MEHSEYLANLALATRHNGRQVAVTRPRQFCWLSRVILRICGF